MKSKENKENYMPYYKNIRMVLSPNLSSRLKEPQTILTTNKDRSPAPKLPHKKSNFHLLTTNGKS